MPLPVPPSASDPATAPVSTAKDANVEKPKAVIKQFGPAKDDAGNDIPAPSPLGFDLVNACKDLYKFVMDKLAAQGIDPNKFVEALELNKETVPGSKNGKAAYATANAIASICKHNGLLNKERGAGGYAKLKDAIAKKDSAIEALKARLVEMGMKPEDIEKTLAGTAA